MRHRMHRHECHHEGREGFWFIGGRGRGGGRGFGGFGGGFMGGGGAEFRTGRKLGSADLQLLVLAQLAEKPSHGYEIIKALDEKSGGFYSPSPGMIYPALTYLEELGYATVETSGAKKLYTLTSEGNEHLAVNRAAVDALLAQLKQIGERMDNVRRAFSGEEGGSEDDELPGRGRAGFKEIWAARHELKAAMHSKKGSSPEEYRRIADILRRAAAEILGK